MDIVPTILFIKLLKKRKALIGIVKKLTNG